MHQQQNSSFSHWAIKRTEEEPKMVYCKLDQYQSVTMMPKSIGWFFVLVSCSVASQIALPYQARTLKTSEAEYSSPPRPARPSNSGQQCGETRKVAAGDHGVIESPGYPGVYSAGLDCEWSVEGPPDSQIQATLFDARTQNNLFADISDSLYMSLTGNWSDSQRYSGDFNPVNPLVLLSEGSRLGVRFRSSRLSTGNRGFKIAYYAEARKSPPASSPAADAHTALVCSYVPVSSPAIFPSTGQSRFDESEDALANITRTNPHPFLVALILDDTQFCSGTLVSPRHVITSAHCTKGVQNFRLIFGTHDISLEDAGVQIRTANASDVLQHPHFDSYTGANDISVIALQENVTFTRFVSRALIPSWNSIALTLSNFDAETVGWGDTQKGAVYAQSGESDAMILPNTFCRTLSKGSSGLTMCTRASAANVCQADSGSPVFSTRNENCPQNNPQGAAAGPQSNPLARPPKPGKPGRPNKPGKPGKPGRPNKPGGRPGKPGKPSRPGGKPSKPGRPSKPNHRPNKPHRPHREDGEDAGDEEDEEYEEEYDEDEEYATPEPVLLGVMSHGSCDRGFFITRITAYLDFLARAAKM